jgi:hypothetical protein
MSAEPLFCKDCKHAERKDGKMVDTPICLKAVHNVNLVTGEKDGRFCEVERGSTRGECCGNDARFFEALQ